MDINNFRKRFYKLLSEIDKDYSDINKIIEIEGRTYNLNGEDIRQILSYNDLEAASSNKTQYILIVSLDKFKVINSKAVKLSKTITVDKQTLGKEIYTVLDEIEDVKLYQNYPFEPNSYPKFFIINKVLNMDLENFSNIKNRILKECCGHDLEDIKVDIIEQIVEMLYPLEAWQVDIFADYIFNTIEPLILAEGDEFSQLNALAKSIEAASNKQLPTLTENAIKHLTSQERLKGKIERRKPRIKRALKIRRLKNKKCPPGTSWSSKTKSCTKIDPKKSRIMKRVAKFRRYT